MGLDLVQALLNRGEKADSSDRRVRLRQNRPFRLSRLFQFRCVRGLRTFSSLPVLGARNGNTTLHCAAIHGHTESVELLLKWKAPLDAQNNGG